MSQLAGYIGPISTAMWVFPFVALLFTVPYVLSSYHRYGAVLFFRALVVYSFIFYLMCVYFLAILPLPSIEEVARETKPWAQLKPFAGLQSALAEAGFRAGDPQTWLRVLGTDSFFYLAANVAMLFPLGIYSALLLPAGLFRGGALGLSGEPFPRAFAAYRAVCSSIRAPIASLTWTTSSPTRWARRWATSWPRCR